MARRDRKLLCRHLVGVVKQFVATRPRSSRLCRPQRCLPYVGLVLTLVILTLVAQIARLEQLEAVAFQAGHNHTEEALLWKRNRYIFNKESPSQAECPPLDLEAMNHTQDTRLRETWRNCNRCTTTFAPRMTSHPAQVTSCGWQKRHLVPRMLTNLVVDDRHRAIYCAIPKVACTNWKRTLVGLHGNQNVTFDVHNRTLLAKMGLRFLHTYKLQGIRMRMAKYYKFLFVRHPLERLLSAYRDKFLKRNAWTEPFQRKYGTQIIKTQRRNPSMQSLLQGHDVTFAEFVRYVVDSSFAGERLEAHWAPYYDLCHPCSIRYHFIGRFEELASEAAHVIHHLGGGGGGGGSCPQASFPAARKGARPPTRTVMADYYSALSREDISRLVQVYLSDFVMYGYDLNFTAYLKQNG